ncbi:MAG: hypothetical protein AABN95_01635, partial [Acidobacteriota bacterium]
VVEATGRGATGLVGVLFLASSRLGKTPSGASGRGPLPWLCARRRERALPVNTSGDISETASKRLRSGRETRD